MDALLALLTLLVKGTGRFASVSIETEPKMNKKGRLTKVENPYIGRVRKRTTLSIRMSAYKPTEPIENRPEAVKWAEYLNPFHCRHMTTGMEYFAFKPEKWLDSEWLLDGQPVEKETFAEFLPPDREDKPAWMLVKLANIRKLTVDGKTVEV